MANYDGNTGIKPFVITVSARALFDLEEDHRIFETQGMDAFHQHQRAKENTPLRPGPVFALVKKLLDINEKLPQEKSPFEIVLLSRNSTDTGLRVLNSLEHYKLGVIRALFTGGRSTAKYIKAVDAKLFLSCNPKEVDRVIQTGVAAATIMPGQCFPSEGGELKLAFDGDSVLFSDEAEKVYGQGGFDAFHEHEIKMADVPLSEGPFKKLLEAIHDIQKVFETGECPIRTCLVTARSLPAHKRAILTLRAWGVDVDEAHFLGGWKKAEFLKAFGADIFFDDSMSNIENTKDAVPSAHVPYGVRNHSTSVGQYFSGDHVIESTAVKVARPRRASP